MNALKKLGQSIGLVKKDAPQSVGQNSESDDESPHDEIERMMTLREQQDPTDHEEMAARSVDIHGASVQFWKGGQDKQSEQPFANKVSGDFVKAYFGRVKKMGWLDYFKSGDWVKTRPGNFYNSTGHAVGYAPIYTMTVADLTVCWKNENTYKDVGVKMIDFGFAGDQGWTTGPGPSALTDQNHRVENGITAQERTEQAQALLTEDARSVRYNEYHGYPQHQHQHQPQHQQQQQMVTMPQFTGYQTQPYQPYQVQPVAVSPATSATSHDAQLYAIIFVGFLMLCMICSVVSCAVGALCGYQVSLKKTVGQLAFRKVDVYQGQGQDPDHDISQI